MERADYGWDRYNPIHAIYWCEDCGFEIMWIKNVRKGRSHLRVLYDPRIDNSLDSEEIDGSPLEEGGY